MFETYQMTIIPLNLKGFYKILKNFNAEIESLAECSGLRRGSNAALSAEVLNFFGNTHEDTETGETLKMILKTPLSDITFPELLAFFLKREQLPAAGSGKDLDMRKPLFL